MWLLNKISVKIIILYLNTRLHIAEERNRSSHSPKNLRYRYFPRNSFLPHFKYSRDAIRWHGDTETSDTWHRDTDTETSDTWPASCRLYRSLWIRQHSDVAILVCECTYSVTDSTAAEHRMADWWYTEEIKTVAMSESRHSTVYALRT